MKVETSARAARSVLEGLEGRLLFAASLVPSVRAGVSTAAAAAIVGVGQNAINRPNIGGVPVAGSSAQTPSVAPPPSGGGGGGGGGGGVGGGVGAPPIGTVP